LALAKLSTASDKLDDRLRSVPHAHSAARADARRLLLVLGLSLAILAVEVVGGVASNSLALLADAAHVFTDVAGIGLALMAIWIGSRPASAERTYGYLRLEILAAVANAVLLFGVAAFILHEAWRRLSEPVGVRNPDSITRPVRSTRE
jgi:cobalt-zinc-cadmium efflux system protein